MKRILIDVDTQVDFIQPHGALYVPADQEVTDHIEEILEASGEYDAVIGSVDSHAYDAWEFKDNGGPFPPHCVKGTPGWLRVWHNAPTRTRFIPMHSRIAEGWTTPLRILVGEADKGSGPRKLTDRMLAEEAVEGKVGLYFEKEVYSLFDNPFAMPVLREIGNLLGGNWNDIQIDVIGYCTGGYCVDAAVEGLCRETAVQRANIRVLSYATAPIGGEDGAAKSKALLTELGAEWVEAP